MESNKYWLVSFFVSGLSLICLVGVFNFIVDPYGLYGNYEMVGFNQQKEGVRATIRHVKALQIPFLKPKTLIMGSSRVHDGVNPENPFLQEYPPVYNLGLDMNRIHETLQFLKYSLLYTDVKRVIFGLDFFMFNALEKVNASFEPGLIAGKVNLFDYLFFSIFSKQAFSNSLRTIKISRAQPERHEFLNNGYRPGKYVFYKLKDYSKLHYNTNYIFLSSLPSSTKYYAQMALDDEVFKDFDEMLIICKQRKIDCRLYISPAHMGLDGEGVRAAGKWEMMEEWKRRVVHIASQYDIPIWDFSGYNSVTTEVVKTPMKYYWDSSHFTELVGNWILARVMSHEKNTENIPLDFGVRLSEKNIETHLKEIRRNRERYVQEHLLEIETLSKTYESFLRGAQVDPEYMKDLFEK